MLHSETLEVKNTVNFSYPQKSPAYIAIMGALTVKHRQPYFNIYFCRWIWNIHVICLSRHYKRPQTTQIPKSDRLPVVNNMELENPISNINLTLTIPTLAILNAFVMFQPSFRAYGIETYCRNSNLYIAKQFLFAWLQDHL